MHKWELCNHIFSVCLKIGYNLLQNAFRNRLIRFCGVYGKVLYAAISDLSVPNSSIGLYQGSEVLSAYNLLT